MPRQYCLSSFLIFSIFICITHQVLAFSECPNSDLKDPKTPGVYNCLTWLAYLQSQGTNAHQWCSDSSNYQKCCLTCQNYHNLTASNDKCIDIAYTGDCLAKKSMGMCTAMLTDAKRVQFYCKKTCNLCVSTKVSRFLSCSNLVNSCNSGTCASASYFAVSSIKCKCSAGNSGTYCQIKDTCVSKPCQNEGICNSYEDDRLYVCQCPAGYSGRNCEILSNNNNNNNNNNIMGNSCSSLNCLNGGKCLTGIAGNGFCSCLNGYTGKLCQTFIGACSSNPCQNGGSCYPTNLGFYCTCLDNYEGNICQLTKSQDPCTSAPCLNGGSCRTTGPTSYMCMCMPNTYGMRCEKRPIMNSCNPNPCKNNGVCNLKGDGSFYCICANGYTSLYCDSTNPCASNPCMNGGSCVLYGISNYSCQCLPRFTGPQCNMIAESTNPTCVTNTQCLNGGSCVSQKCICQFGFTGRICDIKLSCQSNSPCQNGGTCMLSINNVITCQCMPNVYGKYCEYEVTPSLCLNGDRNTERCTMWSSLGLCNFQNTFSSMPLPIYCPKSCALCPLKDQVNKFACRDSQTSCALWATMGLCERINENDSSICAKSCGTCN